MMNFECSRAMPGFFGMRNLTFYCLMILVWPVKGQFQGIVVDAESKEAIPYVNIWVKGKSIGNNSDSMGYYEISAQPEDTLVFSAVGFEKHEIQAKHLQSKVLLKPVVTYLNEVTIEPEKNQKSVLNTITSKKCNYMYGVGNVKEPWMMGVKFNYDDSYSKTPFLDQIIFQTKSEVKNALINIRLYRLDSIGFPSGFLFDENLFLRVAKGKRMNTIDLSKHDIQFPINGLAVVIEWFIIPENKYVYEVTYPGEKKKRTTISYEPCICTVKTENNSNTFMYREGVWRRVEKFGGEDYRAIKVELTLSN